MNWKDTQKKTNQINWEWPQKRYVNWRMNKNKKKFFIFGLYLLLSFCSCVRLCVRVLLLLLLFVCVLFLLLKLKEVSGDRDEEQYSKNEWLVPCALNKLVFTKSKQKIAMIDRWRQRLSRREGKKPQQMQWIW